MRRALVLLCVTGLVATGCKSSGDDVGSTEPSATAATTPGDASTTTEPQEPGVGVSDDAIKVGVIYPDLAAIRDIVNVDHGDYFTAYQAIADDINAKGGINGRMIELVDGPVDVTSADAASTTCTKLTEDEQVFAVVGSLQASAVECYVAQHDTALVGGQQTDDLLATAVAPWFAFTAPIDRLALKTIEGVAAEGGFDGKKVGVITLPIYAPMMESTVNPALDAAGVDVVETAVIDVPDGDSAAANSAAATILEKFRSEGVDLLLAVGDAFLSSSNALSQTDYRPQIVATDANVVSTTLIGRTEFSYFEGLISGSTPSKTVLWTDPAMQECVDIIRKADPSREINDPTNPTEGARDTFVSVITACQGMSLFLAIAEAAGPGLNNDTFRAAGESLGEFWVPGNGGMQNYSADALSGDPAVFLARFDSSTNSLEPDTEPVP
jgi:ABC-type branched-subunit amino acid transport system substrate-binding protein